jgi:hypothetical protein
MSSPCIIKHIQTKNTKMETKMNMFKDILARAKNKLDALLHSTETPDTDEEQPREELEIPREESIINIPQAVLDEQDRYVKDIRKERGRKIVITFPSGKVQKYETVREAENRTGIPRATISHTYRHGGELKRKNIKIELEAYEVESKNTHH